MSVQTLGSDEEHAVEQVDYVVEEVEDVVESGWEYRENEFRVDVDLNLPALNSPDGDNFDTLNFERGQLFYLRSSLISHKPNEHSIDITISSTYLPYFFRHI